MSLDKEIQKIRDEANTKLAEADRLTKLLGTYPDLRQQVNRWGRVKYCSKSVNEKAVRFDMGYGCSCCRDSPLQISPYIETPLGNIYSDPPTFTVGEKDWTSGDNPYPNWEQPMRDAGIPESIIELVQFHFQKCEENRSTSNDEVTDEDS